MIESTSGDVHKNILKSASSWALQFSIGAIPLARSTDEDLPEGVREEIVKVSGAQAHEPNITVFPGVADESYFDLIFSDLWLDIGQSFSKHKPVGSTPPQRPNYAHVSVPLKSGQWLNVAITPRPLGAHASPLLVQFATMAAISAIGIILVLGRLTQPLKELAQAASALGRGEAAGKLAEKGPTEVIETIRAFNDMQERLSRFLTGPKCLRLSATTSERRSPA